MWPYAYVQHDPSISFREQTKKKAGAGRPVGHYNKTACIAITNASVISEPIIRLYIHTINKGISFLNLDTVLYPSRSIAPQGETSNALRTKSSGNRTNKIGHSIKVPKLFAFRRCSETLLTIPVCN